jgi:hypothetical protein
MAQTLPERLPKPGELVRLRSRRWLVEEIDTPSDPSLSPILRLACADDDAQGQSLEVFWRVGAISPLAASIRRAGFPPSCTPCAGTA